MGLFDSKKLQNVTAGNPRQLFYEVLRQSSGASYSRDVKFDLFYNVYAFKGVVDGVGCSTLVANTAVAIAKAGVTVCVIDTSVLAPVQDILLKTDESVQSYDLDKEHLDWLDMPYTRKSVLHVSKLDANISVLSFKGKQHGVVDILSTSDSPLLVDMALTELSSKFDIILIDCCHELTEVNTACLQQAQRVIQVWSDSPTVLGCLESFITNCVTLSSPVDKMRNVVCSHMCRDIMGGVDALLQKYKFNRIATSYLSEEVYLQLATGKCLWGSSVADKDITDYNNCIADIACLILNIKPEDVSVDKTEMGKEEVTDTDVEVVSKKARFGKRDIEVESDEVVIDEGVVSDAETEADGNVEVEPEPEVLLEAAVEASTREKKGFFGKRK